MIQKLKKNWHRLLFSVVIVFIACSNAFSGQVQNPGPSLSSPFLQVQSLAGQDETQILQDSKEKENTPVLNGIQLAQNAPTTSVFEQFVQGKLNENISTDIKQFGYDLFEKPISSFAPDDKTPVGPDYVVGPGDEIRISVWGKVEGKWNVIVDRDGNIAMPKVGVIGVTGLTFKELKELLHKELSQYYSGFDMNVSMGALRTMRVYMVGNALRPGAYTISSISTLVNALFTSSGPAKTGTMRDIQVKRGTKTVVHFDVYDLLLKGDKSKDIRLMPEDVIFIPPVGMLVGIAGSVKNPAIYEIKGEKNISELIDMAGGLSEIAFSGRLQVERIIGNARQTVFESDLAQAGDIQLQGGDIVKIYPVVEDKRVVRISGAVQRSGDYGFRPGMTVKELLSLSGGLKYYAFDKEAELTRVSVTENGPLTEKIRINLGEALKGDPQSNIPLNENDYLFIYAVPNWKLYRTVSITGEVKFPGVYTIERGETLSSLINRAGGFNENAYLKGGIFTRDSVRKQQQETINEMVSRLEMELRSAGATAISAASSAEEANIQKVEAEQKSRFIEMLKSVKAKGRVVVKLLPTEKLKGTQYDIPLEEGDSIHIPENPKLVQVVGSVFNQNAFIFEKGKDIENYIGLAGGYMENADKKRVYILKANGSASRPSGKLFDFSNDENQGLDSGDTIVVPVKTEKVAWLRETKDITQVLYQIAVTAGVLIVAF